TLNYYSTDSTFMKLEIPADGTDWTQKQWNLYLPDGRRIMGKNTTATGLWDANNNHIQFVSDCYDSTCDQPFTAIRDDLGREIRIDVNTDLQLPPTQRKDVVHRTGPNGDVTWIVNWDTLQIGSGTTREYYCQNPGYTVHCYLNSQQLVVTSIILPSTPATTYSFSYSDNADQAFCELDNMKTPTGAEYRYRYRLEGTTLPTTVDIAQFNNVTTKKITHDGLADDFVWTYTFTNPSSTITDTKTGAASTHFFFDRQTPY